METVAQALGGPLRSDALRAASWAEAVAKSRNEFERERRWKVMLAVSVFSEVEVTGTIHTADRRAEQCADQATVILHTAPVAYRFFVEKRTDPRKPESPLEWVEVVHQRVDPFDAASPLAWQLKRK